jgi:hypothetical protein
MWRPHATQRMPIDVPPKPSELPMTEKPNKPSPKRAVARKPRTRRRKPTHRDISRRAYFIHLEEPGSDELGNWLRAERELMPA